MNMRRPGARRAVYDEYAVVNTDNQHGLYTALAKPRLGCAKFSSSLRRVLITFPDIQANA